MEANWPRDDTGSLYLSWYCLKHGGSTHQLFVWVTFLLVHSLCWPSCLVAQVSVPLRFPSCIFFSGSIYHVLKENLLVKRPSRHNEWRGVECLDEGNYKCMFEDAAWAQRNLCTFLATLHERHLLWECREILQYPGDQGSQFVNLACSLCYT